MNDMLQFIKSRRSTRAFAQRPVEQDKLEEVIEAGRYAPSGGNSQSCHLIVVKDRAVLDKLAELVESAFASMEETPGMYSSMVNSIRRARAGGYRFHYDAPVLIITANKKDYGNNMADCACMLENMMLMANALDLGSCWINQLKWLQNDPALLEYMMSLGMRGDERVYGALAVGYANTADALPVREPLPRKGNEVTWVE